MASRDCARAPHGDRENPRALGGKITHILQKLLAVVGIYRTPLVGAIDEGLGIQLLRRFRMLFEKRLDHLIEGGRGFAHAVSVDKESRHDKDRFTHLKV